jgi:hypothetical protein
MYPSEIRVLIENNDGKSPIDLVNEQYLEKALESMENFLRHI